MTPHISANAAAARVVGPDEVALIDLREAGPFSMGHPLFAVPCPWSLFEPRIAHLVPRRTTPIMLIRDDAPIAERAAAVLLDMGYADVSVVDGGIEAWRAAGLPLYCGVNVPSKTLGELAEAAWHPPTITPETLADWRAEGRPFDLVDCRPPAEFTAFSVPGAVCCPNGELAHRLPAFESKHKDGPLVVTCAGRTRGLIGVLGLCEAGHTREIYALENGTQGWMLSGHELDRGAVFQSLPDLDDAGRLTTRSRAEALLERLDIPKISGRDAAALHADPDRTTYLFDVRSEAEARTDPLPAFPQVWSGQIVQATDATVGVRNARIVLADDLGLRAGLAAFWLRMLGYDVYVVPVDDAARAHGEPPADVAPPTAATEIDAADALRAVEENKARIIDFRSSDAHRTARPEGAVWCMRSDVLEAVRDMAQAPLLLGDESPRATLALGDLVASGRSDGAVISGGLAALADAGAAISASEIPARRDSPDVTWFADGRHQGDVEASRLYLAWEQNLTTQLTPEERAVFRI